MVLFVNGNYDGSSPFMASGGGNNTYFEKSPEVPEPNSFLMFGSGLLRLVGVARRRVLS